MCCKHGPPPGKPEGAEQSVAASGAVPLSCIAGASVTAVTAVVITVVAIVIGIVITAALGGLEGGDLGLEGLDFLLEALWSPCGRSLTVGRPQLALPPFSDDDIAFGERQVKPLIVRDVELLVGHGLNLGLPSG